MTDYNDVESRAIFFVEHILPWIILALGIISILICIWHCRKGGQCNPKKENNEIKQDEFDSGYSIIGTYS